MSRQNNNLDEKLLKVRRGRVDSVDLFEVKENELDILESGGADSIYLNFSIFLISTAISSIIAISTATFDNETIKYSFLFVAIIGIILGLLLLILWWRGRNSIKKVVKQIRNRIPSELLEQEKETITTEEDDVENPDSTAPKG